MKLPGIARGIFFVAAAASTAALAAQDAPPPSPAPATAAASSLSPSSMTPPAANSLASPTVGPSTDRRVDAATAGLNLDDETRSRYRWHNGEWWFQSRSGAWKFHRDNSWRTFDPTTYRPLNAGTLPQTRAASGLPQTYAPNGTYDPRQPYAGTRPHGFRTNPDRYDGRAYGGTRNYDGRFDGRYYDPQGSSPYGVGGPAGYQGSYGTGYRGYDPGTNRYYVPNNSPAPISSDRYRGAVIGSEIGGRLGGNTGAILGGAIGADAADK